MKKNGFLYIIITGVLFAVMAGILGVNFYYRSRWYSASVITEDLKTLQDIFKRIDESCTIMSFDAPISPINYLTVRSFESSEIGAMNLAYSSNWQGPYLEDNLTVQGIDYQIVRTKKGHFITPGNGVMLPTGKELGKDIVLKSDSDITLMAAEEGVLMYNGKPLAVPMPLKSTAWQKLFIEQELDVE